MDRRERLNETTLPNKKYFYSKLYLEDITDEDYIHAQKVVKNLGGYLDLYVQSYTLLLPDEFEYFRIKCIQIYKLDPAHFCLLLVWISMASLF